MGIMTMLAGTFTGHNEGENKGAVELLSGLELRWKVIVSGDCNSTGP